MPTLFRGRQQALIELVVVIQRLLLTRNNKLLPQKQMLHVLRHSWCQKKRQVVCAVEQQPVIALIGGLDGSGVAERIQRLPLNKACPGN